MLAPYLGAVPAGGPQALQSNDHPHKDFGVEARVPSSADSVSLAHTTKPFCVHGNSAVKPHRCRRRLKRRHIL